VQVVTVEPLAAVPGDETHRPSVSEPRDEWPK
jgi:hypothetical protein